MTALAIRDDQAWWSEEQAAVLQQAGIDNDVTKAELQSFLHLCQRTGLDPFARQVYLVGRFDKRASRKVYNPQTGIDGYRVVAQRTCERLGQALSYDDTLWCGTDGEWRDVWLADEPPAAAKVTVMRDGSRFSAVARWGEYVVTNREGVPSGLWNKMPALMLAKCAEALTLRKAFPNDLAGVYTSEEMAQADNRPAPASVEQIPQRPVKVSELDAAEAERRDIPVEQARQNRLETQRAARDLLGTKADGSNRTGEPTVTREQSTAPTDDLWATGSPDAA